MVRRRKDDALVAWAKRAIERMKELGLTRTHIGEALDNISEQSVGKRFRGEADLSLAEAGKLAALLRMPAYELFAEHITIKGEFRCLPLLNVEEITPWLDGTLDTDKLPDDRFLRTAIGAAPGATLGALAFRVIPGPSAIILSPGILPTDILQLAPGPHASSSARPFVSWSESGVLVVHHLLPEPTLLGIKTKPFSLIPNQVVPPIQRGIGEVVAQHRSYG